ncbi:hypothetical protein ACWGPT_19000 [Pseudorhizobium sp. NPDC055634]
MRNIIASISEAAQAVAVDFRDACSRHFSLSIGGTMPGLFIKVPLLPLSAWVEWGAPAAGFGVARNSETDLEFFLGRVRGVFSVEPKAERGAP